MSVFDTYRSVQEAAKFDIGEKKHLEFVRRIARSFKNKMPNSLCLDDLVQVGLITLLDIYDKYDSRAEVSFEAFSGKRVRGAMIDLIRQNSPVSKEKVSLIRRGQSIIDEFVIKNGFKPRESHVAKMLGVPLEKYQSVILEYESVFSVDVNEVSVFDSEVLAPEDLIDEVETKRILIDSLKMLSDREQRLVSLYFMEELTQSEIAQVLDVTESRVSQMLKSTLVKLRGLFQSNSGSIGSKFAVLLND